MAKRPETNLIREIAVKVLQELQKEDESFRVVHAYLQAARGESRSPPSNGDKPQYLRKMGASCPLP